MPWQTPSCVTAKVPVHKVHPHFDLQIVHLHSQHPHTKFSVLLGAAGTRAPAPRNIPLPYLTMGQREEVPEDTPLQHCMPVKAMETNYPSASLAPWRNVQTQNSFSKSFPELCSCSSICLPLNAHLSPTCPKQAVRAHRCWDTCPHGLCRWKEMPCALQQAGAGPAPALGEPPARRRAPHLPGLVARGGRGAGAALLAFFHPSRDRAEDWVPHSSAHVTQSPAGDLSMVLKNSHISEAIPQP